MDATERRRRAGMEAAQWWVRMQGEPARAEREEFVDWLRESPVHVAEMLRIARVHSALEQFERWAGLPMTGGAAETADNVVAISDAPRLRKSAPPRAGSALKSWVLAAALGAITLLASALWFHSRGNVLSTDRGERREVALADGSVVQMDPETRLRVKYRDAERRVYLDKGRALFRVAKNPLRPFLVEARDTTVRAVGTAFGVEKQQSGVIVTVAEGKVTVFHSGSAGREAVANAPLLLANQQITMRASTEPAAVRVVDSAKALAWAQGRLIFENTPVAEAIRQFNRYNRLQLHVIDAQLAQRPVSGIFSAADPESFVAFIRTVIAVTVTRDDEGGITIDAQR